MPLLRAELRRAVAYAFLVAAACSPLARAVEQRGPHVTLSATTRTAEHTLTFCLDGPEIDGLGDEASIELDLWMSEGTAGTPVKGHVVAAGRTQPFELALGQLEQLRLPLDPAGTWNGRAGRRCAEPQALRFEYDSTDDETAKILLAYEVHFAVYQGGLLLCGETVKSQEPSVEIVEEPAPI